MELETSCMRRATLRLASYLFLIISPLALQSPDLTLLAKLVDLDDYTDKLCALRYAASSASKVRTACTQLELFMNEYSIQIDPKTGMSDTDLPRRYIAHLARRGVQYKTIANYISMGVRRWHIDRNIPFIPLCERPRVQDAQQGARRFLGDSGGKQKQPITIEILRDMRAKTSLADPFQLCLFAAITTGMFCLLRKGNLAVKTLSVKKSEAKFSSGVIRRSDLSVDQLGNLWITLTHTKTIQFGERKLNLPIPKIGGNSLICPTAILQLYVQMTAGRPADEQLFGYLDARHRWVPLTHAVLVRHIKQLVVAIGLDPTKYAGHSLRRGGATFGFNEAHLDPITIKALGDWVSDTFMRYCEVQMSVRLAGAARMAQAAARLSQPAS